MSTHPFPPGFFPTWTANVRGLDITRMMSSPKSIIFSAVAHDGKTVFSTKLVCLRFRRWDGSGNSQFVRDGKWTWHEMYEGTEPLPCSTRLHAEQDAVRMLWLLCAGPNALRTQWTQQRHSLSHARRLNAERDRTNAARFASILTYRREYALVLPKDANVSHLDVGVDQGVEGSERTATTTLVLDNEEGWRRAT